MWSKKILLIKIRDGIYESSQNFKNNKQNPHI